MSVRALVFPVEKKVLYPLEAPFGPFWELFRISPSGKLMIKLLG